MIFKAIIGTHQFLWSIESHAAQRLAWRDAVEARLARERAEAGAALQLHAMLIANPSGSLGSARLDDDDALKQSGLL